MTDAEQVLEENGGTHDMLRMLGHVTQNHALARLGDFVTVSTAATGLQALDLTGISLCDVCSCHEILRAHWARIEC